MAKKKKTRKIRVKGFIRKGGVRVKGFIRKAPRLSGAERKRRAELAKKILLPAAIKATGKKGFAKTALALAKHSEITSPTKLAGWLKGQAKAMGVLSSEHAYRGRKRTLPPSLHKALSRLR